VSDPAGSKGDDRRRGGSHAKPERNAAIVAAHAAGEPMTSIGKRYGITPVRVRHIVFRAKRKEGHSA
jgi:hypothetical protein